MVTTFPEVDAWDAERGVVTFLAVRGGKTVACSITGRALSRRFGTGEAGSPLACFRKHRAEMEMVATRLLDAQNGSERHLSIDL